MQAINQMLRRFKGLWDRILIWLKLKEKAKPKFRLSLDTIDQVEMYGGIEWKNDALNQQLALCKSDEDKKKLLETVRLEREFVETETNREYLSLWFNMLTPEQKQYIEDKVNNGERLYRYDVKKHFSIARAKVKQSEPEF